MIWTHFYDLILKSATLAVCMILLINFPGLEENFIASLPIGFILAVITYYFVVRSFATWLYCRLSLKMKISINQARYLDDAFSPLSLTWLPMTELSEIDHELKYPAALSMLANWQSETRAERKQQWIDFKSSKMKTKVLTVLLYVCIGAAIVVSSMNLPPASYLTLGFCWLFDTDKYYPMLNIVLLLAVVVFVFRIIDKDIKYY